MKNKKLELESEIDLRIRLDSNALSWDLFLFGEVEHRKIAQLIQHMLVLDATNDKRAINLLICSPGGYCSAGYALIDTISGMRHVVRTVALGEICSMGSLIFIAGTPGQRYIGSRTQVLFHPMSEEVADYGSFIKDRVKSIDHAQKLAKDLMRSRTGLPADMVESSERGEVWLDAGEAIKYKVADTIITDNEVISSMYKELLKERARVIPKKAKK